MVRAKSISSKPQLNIFFRDAVPSRTTDFSILFYLLPSSLVSHENCVWPNCEDLSQKCNARLKKCLFLFCVKKRFFKSRRWIALSQKCVAKLEKCIILFCVKEDLNLLKVQDECFLSQKCVAKLEKCIILFCVKEDLNLLESRR